MKLVSKFDYSPLNRDTKEDGSRTYDTPGGKLPSVTTILSRTKDMTFLEEWRERIGEERADMITNRSAQHGRGLHTLLEQYILHGTEPKGNLFTVAMTKKIIKNGLCKVDEVWGTEVALYAKGLYAGTTDLVGVHEGVESVMDFKNSRTERKKEWIEDYSLQTVAYCLAHNEMYNTNIRRGVVMIATQTGMYQEFIYEGRDFEIAAEQWAKRVEQYYEKYRA